MKLLRTFLFTLAISTISISAVQAHDSLSVGINIGSGDRYHAYPVKHHVISHHIAPQVVYYRAPVVYRHHVPVVVQHYYRGESRHHHFSHGRNHKYRDYGYRGQSREHRRGHH